ncbi:MAG: hypothetical protein V8S36_05330 [Lachnospiraceae bacterium]
MPIRKAQQVEANRKHDGETDEDKKDTTGDKNGSIHRKKDGTVPSQASTGKMTAVSYTVVTSTTPAPGEGGSDDSE